MNHRHRHVLCIRQICCKMTFFSEAKVKFLAIAEGEDIPTENFLLSIGEIVPFFDTLGPTMFKPVKADINGNLKRLQKLFDSARDRFSTLQSIVDSEIAEGKSQGSKSCTLAVLWLKRAMEFMFIFLEEVLSGEEDLVKCANKAYDESLRRYHGWIVRGIFHLAVQAVPYRKDFLASLKKDPTVSDDRLYEDMRAALTSGKTHIEEINRFLTEKGQHSDEVV